MDVWGITDGSAGMNAQVLALGDALGVAVEMKKITLKKSFAYFPNILYGGWVKKSMLLHSGIALNALPDLVISCGRKGALVAAAIKSCQPQVRVIHIQDPQMSPRYFDLVIAMAHDKVRGENVLVSNHALHSITPEKLAAAREKFMPVFAPYLSPRVAVLLGGSTNKYTLTEHAMRDVISQMEQFLARGASLLITPSRRTGAQNIALLAQHFAGNERVYIYDGQGENPYLGLLAIADEIAVSNDSVNMMSEAYATGKPLHILPFEGHTNTKPACFAETLLAQKNTHIDEMASLAAGVKARLIF